MEVEKLAINDLDDIAVLERGEKTVVIIDRAGNRIGRLVERGTAYRFRRPVDLSYDPFGHLYVLDRDSGTVFIFDVNHQLIANLTIEEDAPGSFRRARALALDSAARLYIFDERSRQVQIYQ